MENITWARVDMGLLVKCSTQYLTSVCSERVSIEFNTWREVLYLKATRNNFFYDINTIGLYWQEKFDSINWLMMNAMPFIYQPVKMARRASGVSAADWRYQTHVRIIVIWHVLQLRLFSGLEIHVKHRSSGGKSYGLWRSCHIWLNFAIQMDLQHTPELTILSQSYTHWVLTDSWSVQPCNHERPYLRTGSSNPLRSHLPCQLMQGISSWLNYWVPLGLSEGLSLCSIWFFTAVI